MQPPTLSFRPWQSGNRLDFEVAMASTVVDPFIPYMVWKSRPVPTFAPVMHALNTDVYGATVVDCSAEGAFRPLNDATLVPGMGIMVWARQAISDRDAMDAAATGKLEEHLKWSRVAISRLRCGDSGAISSVIPKMCSRRTYARICRSTLCYVIDSPWQREFCIDLAIYLAFETAAIGGGVVYRAPSWVPRTGMATVVKNIGVSPMRTRLWGPTAGTV